MTREYSDQELMAVLISREVRDGEISATGAHSQIAAAGLLLARETHAPNGEVIILGSKGYMPFRTSRQFHYLAQRGELGLFFVSGVQIDRHGNYNLHMVGSDQDKPERRFPGGYGGGMIFYAAKRTIIFRTEHSARSLVEKVDFISAAGSTPPDILRFGGPARVITPMATLAMNPDSRLLTLESVNAPHSVETVVENTGFDLGDTSAVGESQPPTEAELATLREAVRRRMIESGTYPDWAETHLGGLRVA